MKYLFITINVSILFFAGCVDTYTVKDFSSPEKFYNTINEKVKDRTIKVVTDSNDVYKADKLIVRPDSIFFTTTKLARSDEYKSSYSSSEIKEMYQRADYKDGLIHTILLNNGDKVSSRYILIKNDSLFLYDIIPVLYSTIKKISLTTSEVNSISFNNRLIGMGEGALFYALVGVLVGIRNADITSGDQEAIPPEIAAIGGAIVFGLGGAVVGTAIGSYQEYIINEPKYNYHGLTSFELIGGVSTSGLGLTINGSNSSSDLMVDYSAGISLVLSFNNELGIKSGILFSSKGGGFDQYIASESFTYHRDIFVNQIEIPILLQYSFRKLVSKPRIYAGPQLDFFRNGRIDNLYNIKDDFSNYPSSHQIFYRSIDLNEVNNPEYSFVIGTGFNFQKYITIDFQYKYGLTKFSNSLFDGEVTNLKLNSFSILLGYGL